jgi:hypothetical protein
MTAEIDTILLMSDPITEFSSAVINNDLEYVKDNIDVFYNINDDMAIDLCVRAIGCGDDSVADFLVQEYLARKTMGRDCVLRLSCDCVLRLCLATVSCDCVLRLCLATVSCDCVLRLCLATVSCDCVLRLCLAIVSCDCVAVAPVPGAGCYFMCWCITVHIRKTSFSPPGFVKYQND